MTGRVCRGTTSTPGTAPAVACASEALNVKSKNNNRMQYPSVCGTKKLKATDNKLCGVFTSRFTAVLTK